MKNVIEQLSNYKSVHLNNNNVRTHFIGVPAIIWSIAVLLNLLSVNFGMAGDSWHFSVTATSSTEIESGVTQVGLATVVALLILVYYVALHIPLAIFATVIFGPLIYTSGFIAASENAVAIAVAVFVVAWIIQFIGHAYEKAKPAFVDDLLQLLIGPLFLMAEVYFALKLNKPMEDAVHEKAVEKRKLFEQAKRA